MDSIEFINRYQEFLKELKEIVDPKFYSILKEMEDTDPHDLVTPETWFINQHVGRGYVYSLFLKKIKDERGE